MHIASELVAPSQCHAYYQRVQGSFAVSTVSSEAWVRYCRWVRSLAFDPGNEWLCTGSADRTIKIWDLATGQLKLTLTGHIEQVRDIRILRALTLINRHCRDSVNVLCSASA